MKSLLVIMFSLLLVCEPAFAELDILSSNTVKTETKITPIIGELTEEQTAISEKVFKVSVTEYPPFIIFSTNPAKKQIDISGVTVELLDIISEKIGIQFKIVREHNYEHALDNTISGSSDIFFNASKFTNGVFKSFPYMIKGTKIVTVREKPISWNDLIKSGKDNPAVLAELIGSNLHEFFKNLPVTIFSIEAETPLEILAKLSLDDASFTLMDPSMFGYYQQKLQSYRLIATPDSEIFERASHLGFSPTTNPAVISAVNKAIASMSKNEVATLENIWKKTEYIEPTIRPNFALLLFIIAFSAFNNIIWYLFYVKSMGTIERDCNRKWLAAVTETVENERRICEIKLKKLQKS